ncbi:MAG: protein phosphatase 2C domain-containing protein [Clostridiales bacterium]|nr:protein phosphatase 2C domain-containing protein [Clostridiales bacterium]
MNIDTFSYTDKGTRALNEDSYNISEGDTKSSIILCDGLGGHNCGEVASQTASKLISEGILKLDKISPEGIYSVISKVNEQIINLQIEHREYNGMRTTAVGCIFVGRELFYFNVGDSRFYFFKNGVLKYMTKDHSVSQMSVELGDISFDDIRGDADRNKLLKVLGERYSGEIASIYKPLTLNKGDAFLICSDGFWEYVLENEMEIDLSKSETAEEWVKYMFVRLFLKMSGSNDNYTVIGGIVK